jgi:eukaryotic-like serine/threonine-protein kinase
MKLKRDVALKVLPEAFAGDPGRMLRFQREAEVLASLNHPNIAHIYGVEQRALVMELVEGETLSGPLPVETALKYARQIAEALEYAHERGVIHRDLKPANIKVTTEGTVKLLDFGLAKATEDPSSASEDPSNSPTLTLGATSVGVIMGTAAYMSPEQASGKSVDKRADIWSFGAVLYEMLAGKKAFEGESVSDTLAAVIKLDPDWSALPRETPASVQKLVRRCLMKDRKQRLQAIGEARIVLENPGGTEVPLQAEALRRQSIPLVIGSIVLVVALVAVSFVHFREPPPPAPQVIQFTIDAPPKTRMTNFAISPDGRRVAMIATGERGDQIWVRPLDSLQAQPLYGTEGARYPFWSPDSRYIGFFVGGELKKISVTGGPAQTLCDAPLGSGGTWNSEGIIVFGSTNGLSRVSAAGGVPNKAIEVEGPSGFPTFLPDGRRFLYTALSKRPGIYLGSLDAPGSQGRHVSVDVSNPQYLPPPQGSPLGYILFVRGQTLIAQPVDPNSLQPAGDVLPIIEQVSSRGTNIYEYSISRNGILLHRTGLGALRQYSVFDRSGKQLSAVGGPVTDRVGVVALSRDEGRMVSIRGDGAKTDLWITELERGTESRFTFNASRNVAPVWSPDGNYVAFASDRGGSADLYRKAANQAGQDELLWRSEFPKVPTDWSRDGRFIIFRQNSPETKGDLFALPVTGDKKPIPLLHSEFNEIEGTVSPDGRWLAYASNESGSYEVYVQPFGPASKTSSGKWQISIGGGRDPHWRGDGREMFYRAPSRNLMAVTVKTDGDGFVRSVPQRLFEVRSTVLETFVSRYAVSADGKRFLIAADPETSSQSPPLHVTVNWLAGLKK